jgi:LmbE family N-acetylglucosaminyl deacetylase
MRWRGRAVLALAVGAWLVASRVAADEGFRFLPQRGRELPLALEAAADGLTANWPEVAVGEWDTALVGLTVEPDPAATDAPWIELSAGGASGRQYLEPGGRGPHWLNLSPLREKLAPAGALGLRLHGVTAVPGTAPLRLYASRPDLSRRILVLAPHPDDAEIAAFGVYAGRNATIVTVTVGNAGDANYEAVIADPAEHYRFKGSLRLIDSITVPWQGGVPPERCFNLGYFDARLAEMYARPREVVPEMYGPNTDVGVYRRLNIGKLLEKGKPRASTWENLVEDVEDVLKKVKPEVVVLPHPQLDTHLDHQFTAVALAEALSRWKKPATLLLYTNHAAQNRYPFGPAGTIQSLPPAESPGVTLDRVYSLVLTPELQRRKLFALESMHDLRFSPTRQYQLALGDGRALEPEKPGPPPDISYLRRGVQANELFFVYDRDTLDAMIQAFLAGRAQP